MRRDLRLVSAVCRRWSTRVGATIVLSSRSAAATSRAVGRSRGSGCRQRSIRARSAWEGAVDELVQHDPERVDVRLGADLAPLGLLGRQIAECPEDRADLRHARLLDRAGNPEVGDLDDPVRGAQEVRRLQVAVHDPVSVCVREAGGDVGGCGPGQLPALERAAGQQLHDDARAAVELGDVVGAHEVRVMELRSDARFAQEPGPEVLVAREVRGEHLERDRPLELLVPAGVDDGHAAPAELPVDAVGAQSPSSLPWCLP